MNRRQFLIRSNSTLSLGAALSLGAGTFAAPGPSFPQNALSKIRVTGVKTFLVHPGLGKNWLFVKVETVRSVREAVGPEVDILVEVHRRLAPVHAIRVAREIEEFHPFWYEEPVSARNLDALAEVRRAVNLPVVTGEELYTKAEFREVFEKQAADILNPDVGNCGGILELKEIAAMAEPYFVAMSPHNYNSTTVALAATLQACAVMPNFLITEYFVNFTSLGNEISLNPIRVENGYVRLPEGPGLGIELNDEALARYPYRPFPKRNLRQFQEGRTVSRQITLMPALTVGLMLAPPTWKHLSTETGDLAPPSAATQQTASLILDVDADGVNDFVIGCRREVPSAVWYRRGPAGWTKYLIENAPLNIEAGGAFHDIDGDGDLDIAFGGDASQPEVWWWENPYPEYQPDIPWRRYLIKDSGESKHHDQLFGDFDGDGKEELVFWNQNARTLFWAEVPEHPPRTEPWSLTAIYRWSGESEPAQRGTYPSWKRTNEHEGLAKADVDGDGKLDIIGGGRWFKHEGGMRFSTHVIDENYCFTRAAAGQLKRGGQPEVVLVVGDGIGPLLWYEWREGSWRAHELLDRVENGHSLQVLDVNQDGNPDIFLAEMRLNEDGENARMLFFLADGSGNFTQSTVAVGYGNHESKVGDLDGDGDLDILGKPYNWKTPRLDLWLDQTR